MSTDYTRRIVNYALKAAGFYPLRPIQKWLIDTHFNKANSTMMNIGGLYKLDDSIDMEKFAAAINETVAANDIFSCRLVFHEETSDLCQRFDGVNQPVAVEKMSDAEFEKIKTDLKKPYRLINNPLYRFKLIETPTAKYFYADFYHAMFDGTAEGLLLVHEINSRYKGKKISRTPAKYADYILNELRISPEELAAGNKYWREMLAGYDYQKYLPPADVHAETAWKSNNIFYDFKNISAKYFAKKICSEHVFFLAASMLTTAKLSGEKKSYLSWIHNGRNNMLERRLMGIMLEQYPISCDFSADVTVAEILRDVEQKVSEAPKYRRSLETIYDEGLQDDCATFILQKAGVTEEDGFTLGGKPASFVDMPDNKWSAAENIFDIEIFQKPDGSFGLNLDYDASRYSLDAAENFAATLDEIVLQLQDENKFVSEILK